MLKPGDRIDRYIVEGELGEGALATVYKVRHATLGTLHALKVVKIAHREARERLILEGRVQARLNHENIVNVTDVLNVKGSPATLMEFVRGIDLEALIQRHFLDLDEALVLFRGVVCGVGQAHVNGLVHRDLKPANVMLAVEDGRVVPKVTDFGLVKAVTGDQPIGGTRSGVTMGTPGFMPPEQIRDASTVDRRADMWALGCILYRLVCHMPAFPQGDLIELFSAVAAGTIPDPRGHVADLPDNVVAAIHALLVVEPNDRMQSCTALLELLDDGIAPPAPTEALLPPIQPETWRTCHLTNDSKAGAASITMLEVAEAELERNRAAHPTLPPVAGVTLAPETRRRYTWLVAIMFVMGIGAIGLGATGGLGVISTLLWNETSKPPQPVMPVEPGPKRVPALVTKVKAPRPDPIPVPTAQPVPVPPKPVPAQPVPAGEPKPAPDTVPAPVVPKPEAEPAPEHGEASGPTGEIICDPCEGVIKSWINVKGADRAPNRSLAKGTYIFHAQFKNAEEPLEANLEATLEFRLSSDSEHVRIKCLGNPHYTCKRNL